MGRNIEIATGREPQHAFNAQATVCPACRGRLTFRGSAPPRIDACGFETYALDCPRCGATLVGVIDPLDGTLLLVAAKSVETAE